MVISARVALSDMAIALFSINHFYEKFLRGFSLALCLNLYLSIRAFSWFDKLIRHEVYSLTFEYLQHHFIRRDSTLTG